MTRSGLLHYFVLCAFLWGCASVRADNMPAPSANPEAVAAYNEGMHQLEVLLSRRDFKQGEKPDFAPIESLFNKAATLDLPHAYYGLACLIYSAQLQEPKMKDRLPEAYELALYAAHRHVLEAQALVINLINNDAENNVSNSSTKELLLEELYERTNVSGVTTGALGTVPIENQAEARHLVEKSIDNRIGLSNCSEPFYKTASHGLYVIWMHDKAAAIQQAKIPPANPDAVVAYRKGMDLIDRPPRFADYARAEQQFKKAMALDLPHAYYGMACLINAAGWKNRTAEMLSDTKYAADHEVLEAKALYVWFSRSPHRLLHTPQSEFDKLWEATYLLAQKPGLVSGAPGTVAIDGPEEATRLIYEIAGRGHCGQFLFARQN